MMAVVIVSHLKKSCSPPQARSKYFSADKAVYWACADPVFSMIGSFVYFCVCV